MSGCDAQKTIEEIKNTNIVSLYDPNHLNGTWVDEYSNRIITLTKSGVTFNATILHTCGDESSHNSCSLWAKGGVLIQLEYL
jgi:hypothetical protein